MAARKKHPEYKVGQQVCRRKLKGAPILTIIKVGHTIESNTGRQLPAVRACVGKSRRCKYPYSYALVEIQPMAKGRKTCP